MHFKLRSNCASRLNITINNIIVPQTTEVTYLGFTIDSGLTWSSHIDKLCDKLSSACYALSRLAHCLSEDNMKVAYYGYFHSIMMYGISLWGTAADRERVFRLQKRAVRILCKKPCDHPAKDLFRAKGILTLPSLYVLECCKYVKKHLDNLPTLAHQHGRSTRNRNLLCIPLCKLTKSQKLVQFMGIKIYNTLPDSIKQLPTLNLFIAKLKSALMEMSCYNVEEFMENIGSLTYS